MTAEQNRFQSTHSVGSGTGCPALNVSISIISIHPLRGEWDLPTVASGVAMPISIHPLRGEWDLSIRRYLFVFRISIHPLREEWDRLSIVSTRAHLNFNPPTPWGVGHKLLKLRVTGAYFNPPTPWGVGQFGVASLTDLAPISIHPLRGEWDCQDCSNTLQFQYFNPPTPWGVGRRRQFYTALIGHFNPPTPWGVGLSVHFAY